MPDTTPVAPETSDDTRSRLRRAEAREDLLRHAFACLPDVIAIAGSDDRAVHVNEPARGLAGLDSGVRVLCALADAGVSHTVLADLLTSIERRGRGTAEIQLLDRRGEIRDVAIEGTSAPWQEYVLVLRDVTERRRIDDELARARRMDASTPLMAGAIHDFNNLLTPIVSASARLAASLDPGTAGHEMARDIQAMAETAVRLAREIMAFARTGATSVEDVDVNGVVSGIKGLLHHVLREDVALDVELDDRIGTVRADRAQLEHVVINLAANARDAMPNGGRLTIRTAELPALGDAPAQVAVTFVDTGIGMDPETCRKALDPFFTTKAASGGTGLGLATAQRFATQAGGRIAVRSSAGEGTTVTLYLPRTPRDTEPDA